MGLPAVGVAVSVLLTWQMHVNLTRAEEGGPSAGSGEAEPLDPVTWSRVRELRERLRLSDATLAAMECTRETAEGVLTRLVAWYEANSAQWANRRREVAAAWKALRLGVRRLNVGLAEGAERPDVPQLKASLVAARGAEAELLAACRANVEPLLTDSQKGLWSTIRGNPATAVEYACAPNVTKAQLTALSLARTKAARRRAAADNGTAPTRGGSAVGAQVSVGDVFTPAQRAGIAAS